MGYFTVNSPLRMTTGYPTTKSDGITSNLLRFGFLAAVKRGHPDPFFIFVVED